MKQQNANRNAARAAPAKVVALTLAKMKTASLLLLVLLSYGCQGSFVYTGEARAKSEMALDASCRALEDFYLTQGLKRYPEILVDEPPERKWVLRSDYEDLFFVGHQVENGRILVRVMACPSSSGRRNDAAHAMAGEIRRFVKERFPAVSLFKVWFDRRPLPWEH
jgi:hypothetical protein